MNNIDVDVAIVGAGLGGLSAAISLLQKGKTVALFEGHELGKHKVCGEFISPESRLIFEELGVLRKLEEAGARPISSARIMTSGRVGREIPFPHAGIGISRHLSDPLLWEHAQNMGAQCFEKTRVEEVRREGGGFILHTAGFECRASYTVAATGRNGRHFGETTRQYERKTSKYMGIKTHFRGISMPDNQVQLFSYEGGYCGVVRVENDVVNACALVDYKRSRHKTPVQIWKSILNENRNLNQILGSATPEFPWLATGNVSFNNFTPVTEGILRVGDAAGYIHPLSGDGMAMAIRSGQMAAEAIGNAKNCAGAASIYDRLWHEEFDRRLAWARWLQPLMTHRKWALPALAFFDFTPALMQKLVVVTRSK